MIPNNHGLPIQHGLWVLLFVGLLVGCSPDGGSEPAGILPLPKLPDLSTLNPAAAERLRAQRRRVEEMLAAGSKVDDTAVAQAAGEIGMLLHAYELPEQAEAWYSMASSRDPSAGRWVHYRGVLAWGRGDLGAANDLFEQASTKSPTEIAPALWLARIAQTLGETETARRHLQRAQQTQETGYGSLGLATLALEDGRPEAALELLERAREVAPESSDVTHALARTWMALGDPEQAERALAALSPGDRDGSRTPFPDPWMKEISNLLDRALFHEGRGHRFLRSGQGAAAAAEFRQALVIDPDLHRVRHNLASLLLRLGQKQQAIEHLETVVASHPRQAASWVLLASVREEEGDLALATEFLESALEGDPDSALAHGAMGGLLRRQRRCNEALAALERSLLLDPRQEEVHRAQVLCLETLGRSREAGRAAERAVASLPASDRLRDLKERLQLQNAPMPDPPGGRR